MNATVQMTIKLEVKGVTLELSLEEAMELRQALERVAPHVWIGDRPESPVVPLPMPYPAPIYPTYPTAPTWQPVWSDGGVGISEASSNGTLKIANCAVANDGSFTIWGVDN